MAFAFVSVVGSASYLSPSARRYKIEPLIKKLKANLDDWNIENVLVKELLPFAAVIPSESVDDYVWALTHAYVGYTGKSAYFARTNFYADIAALYIPQMFHLFDDKAAEAFVNCIRISDILRSRIQNPSKLSRLRSLGNIVLSRVSAKFTDRKFLELLIDAQKEDNFLKNLKRKDE